MHKTEDELFAEFQELLSEPSEARRRRWENYVRLNLDRAHRHFPDAVAPRWYAFAEEHRALFTEPLWSVRTLGELVESARLAPFARVALELHAMVFETDLAEEDIHAMQELANVSIIRNVSLRYGIQDLVSIFESPHLTNLEEAYLSNTMIPDQLASAIAASPSFPRLRILEVFNTGMDADSARALAAAPGTQALEVLRLGNNPIGQDGIDALARSGVFSSVRLLDLNTIGLTRAGLEALCYYSGFERLTTLNLARNPITDRGVRTLCAAPFLARVEELNLAQCALRDHAIHFLVASAHTGALSVLELEHNDLTVHAYQTLATAQHLSAAMRNAFAAKLEEMAALLASEEE